jgi:hypothetical protein
MKKKTFDYKTIKSFEDACKKEGQDPSLLPDVSMIEKGMGKTLIATYKLFVIFMAINDGWKPNWNNSNEWKYFPWFRIQADAARPSGFVFSCSNYVGWVTSSDCGSRLCTDSSEKALYIAKQFEAEYIDFILTQK